MPIPIWAGRYIGLSFTEHGRDRTGLDCWGLARLVQSEQFNIALPSFAHEYGRTSDAAKIAAVIARELPRWQSVDADHEKCGDLIILRLRGEPMHIGTVLGDGYMLHIERGVNAAIEKTHPRGGKTACSAFAATEQGKN